MYMYSLLQERETQHQTCTKSQHEGRAHEASGYGECQNRKKKQDGRRVAQRHEEERCKKNFDG